MWQFKKIKDVGMVTAGQSPEGIYYNENGKGLPFYQGKKEFTEKYIGPAKVWTTKITKTAEVGDVLMSVRAPVGPVNFATKQCCIGRGLAAIRVTEKFNKDFLFLFFKHIENELTGNTGAVFNSINKSQIENISIPFPPLSEQQQIVEKLDSAFDLIDRAKANIEKNIQNAKELFQSKLNQVFSEKGEDWKEMKLESVCTLLNGRAYNRQELLSDGKYRVLRVGNFFTNKHWYYSDLELDENKYCDKGDLLYAWSASFGPRIWQEEKVIYHYHIWKVLPNDFIKKDFLYILLDWDKEKIKKESGAGTTMVHVSKGSMEKRVLPIPPIALQERIVAQVEQLLIQTELLQQKYQQKLANLEELKKSILEKAFKGELV